MRRAFGSAARSEFSSLQSKAGVKESSGAAQQLRFRLRNRARRARSRGDDQALRARERAGLELETEEALVLDRTRQGQPARQRAREAERIVVRRIAHQDHAL